MAIRLLKPSCSAPKEQLEPDIPSNDGGQISDRSRGNSTPPFPRIDRIDTRDRLSLLAGALALLGLILLGVGVLIPQLIVLLVGVGALAGGTGTLAGQRRRL